MKMQEVSERLNKLLKKTADQGLEPYWVANVTTRVLAAFIVEQTGRADAVEEVVALLREHIVDATAGRVR
jgi:hypothetical protein